MCRVPAYLEELDREEVFTRSTVHQVLEHRAHNGFVGELSTLRQRDMDENGSGLDSIKDAISVSHVESIAAFAGVYFGRKQAPRRCILLEHKGKIKTDQTSAARCRQTQATYVAGNEHYQRNPDVQFSRARLAHKTVKHQIVMTPVGLSTQKRTASKFAWHTHAMVHIDSRVRETLPGIFHLSDQPPVNVGAQLVI